VMVWAQICQKYYKIGHLFPGIIFFIDLESKRMGISDKRQLMSMGARRVLN